MAVRAQRAVPSCKSESQAGEPFAADAQPQGEEQPRLGARLNLGLSLQAGTRKKEGGAGQPMSSALAVFAQC